VELKRIAIACVMVAWVALSATARAEVDSPLVKKGLAAYGELDFQHAIDLLEQARNESLTREEKILTYRTLGMARVALGQNDLARTDFAHLLHVDPSYELDRTVAPKVRAIFEEAKAQVAQSGKLAGALPPVSPSLAPVAAREGKPLEVRVDYPGGVARKMTVYYRASGTAAFSRVTVAGATGRFAATIPGGDVRAPALDYHVVLLDDSGASVAAAGTIGMPLSIAVGRAPRPVYKRGWFWGVLGGVAAAGAVAAGVALGLPRSNTAPVTVNPVSRLAPNPPLLTIRLR
jgi:hypothetical protein